MQDGAVPGGGSQEPVSTRVAQARNTNPLTELEMGNLKFHTDFRQIYASVLDQWLGVSSKVVLSGEFKPVEIVKT